MQFHIFVFDEELKSLREQGTPIDLRPFYNLGVSMVHACFVHGTEEILFVDSDAQARVFSLVTLQPKYYLLLFLYMEPLRSFVDLRLYNFHKYHVLFTLPQTGPVRLLFKKRTV